MKENYIKSLSLKNFTAFDEIDFEFSPGINVFIGANATGKTHTLKAIYSIIAATKKIDELKKGAVNLNDADEVKNLAGLLGIVREKFIANYLPESYLAGRMVRRESVGSVAEIKMEISNNTIHFTIVTDTEVTALKYPLNKRLSLSSIYIPPKEILTNAHGFIPEYEKRFLEFEEIYRDILVHAFTPGLKFKGDEPFFGLLKPLEEIIGGKIKVKGDRFYVEDENGLLEFTLLAEGFSKLGLIWLLINNGSIEPGCTLFWDEPEANLNPSLLRVVVKILLELQRHDVQIFVATHNYVLLKEFDLEMEETDEVMFHSLYRDEDTGSIKRESTGNYLGIHPNVILETYLDIYERELRRNFKKEEPNRNEKAD